MRLQSKSRIPQKTLAEVADVKKMKLLLEAEIEAHACFPPDCKDFSARVSTSSQNVEFHLKNGNVEMGVDVPTMIAILVFESGDFESGLEMGRDIIHEILRSLAYVTSATFKYRRSLRLIDWSDDCKEREFKAFKPFPGHELPYYVLEPEHLASAVGLWQSTKDHPMSLAVHWFASGVSATTPEDQFQLFWFSVELLAEHLKPSMKINDPCPVCKSPLFCEKCQNHPTHKPFNRQAIEILIKETEGEERFDIISKRAFKTRNMLMHGATRDQIEAEIGIEMEVCVNDLAGIAKKGIYAAVEPEIQKKGGINQFYFLNTEEYSHKMMTFTVNMRSGPVKAELASLAKIALPEMNLIYSQGPTLSPK